MTDNVEVTIVTKIKIQPNGEMFWYSEMQEGDESGSSNSYQVMESITTVMSAEVMKRVIFTSISMAINQIGDREKAKEWLESEDSQKSILEAVKIIQKKDNMIEKLFNLVFQEVKDMVTQQLA